MDCKLTRNRKINLLFKCITTKNSNYNTCYYESIELRNNILLKHEMYLNKKDDVHPVGNLFIRKVNNLVDMPHGADNLPLPDETVSSPHRIP